MTLPSQDIMKSIDNFKLKLKKEDERNIRRYENIMMEFEVVMQEFNHRLENFDFNERNIRIIPLLTLKRKTDYTSTESMYCYTRYDNREFKTEIRTDLFNEVEKMVYNHLIKLKLNVKICCATQSLLDNQIMYEGDGRTRIYRKNPHFLYAAEGYHFLCVSFENVL